MRNRALQLVLLVVILFGVGFVIYQNIANSNGVLKEGDPAPDFTVRTLDGGEITLSRLRGKGVLVNFWASYCDPCREEMPAIEKLYEKYREQGIEVIGINTGENQVTASSFTKQVNVTFPIALDRDLEVVKQYQVGPLPASFFIKPDGTIQKKFVGQMSEAFIEGNLKAILP